MRAAFRRGYERVSPWPETDPAQVDAFIASRGVGLLNTIMTSTNPEWVEMMPGFAERTEKRVSDLMDKHGVS